MDLNNKKRKGGVALASRRLGRVEKGQPLILGANKMEGSGGIGRFRSVPAFI